MKRTMLLFAIVALAFTVSGAHAATLTTVQARQAYANVNGNGGALFLQVFNYDDPVQNAITPDYFGYVYVQVGANSAYGQGPLTISMDPLGQTGHITGSFPDQSNGTITVSLDFLATQLIPGLNTPQLEAVPTPPQSVHLYLPVGRGGRSNGTATDTSVGTYNVVNAYAAMYSGTDVILAS